jgi:hypothetical protein
MPTLTSRALTKSDYNRVAALFTFHNLNRAKVDAFEDQIGMSLSSAIDELWAEADEGGRWESPTQAARMERFYNRLTQ